MIKKNVITSIVCFLLAVVVLFIGFIVPLFKGTQFEVEDVEREASVVEVLEDKKDYLIVTNEFSCKLFLGSNAIIDREAIENISPGEKIYFTIRKLTVNPLEHPQLEQIFVVSFRTETTDIITIESYKNTEKQSLNKIKSTCVVMASILFCVAIVNVVVSIKKSKQISK